MVLVCGGRTYKDRRRLFRTLDRIARVVDITCIRHGDARGADIMAGEWAEARGFPVDPMAADWDLYKDDAGTIRNAAMLRKRPTPILYVAFRGGSGTANMKRRCRANSVRVLTIP